MPPLILPPEVERQARIDAFQPILQSAISQVGAPISQWTTDAFNTPFVAQFLQAYQSTLYEVKRPKKSFQILMPTDASKVPSGAETYTYGVTEGYGTTKTIQGGANSTDLPQSDVTVKEVTQAVQTEGNGYSYTLTELQNAAMAAAQGLLFPIDQERRKATMRAHEEKHNQVALFGDANLGTKGLLNHPSIPSSVVVDGASTDTEWSAKTDKEIIADIGAIIAAIPTASLGVHQANTLAMPVGQYEYLRGKLLGNDGDRTILTFLEETYSNSNSKGPTISFLPIPELAGAGVGGTDVMIAYERLSDNIEFLIAQAYTEMPPVIRGLGFEVSAQTRFLSGPCIRYPKAFAIRYGI
jgi:hypothetical protein